MLGVRASGGGAGSKRHQGEGLGVEGGAGSKGHQGGKRASGG